MSTLSSELIDLVRSVVKEETIGQQGRYEFFNDYFWVGTVELVNSLENTATVLLPNQTVATGYKKNKTGQVVSIGDEVLLFSPYGTLGSAYISVLNKKYSDYSGATPTALVDSVNAKTGVVVLDATDIGLSNVDNTSDATKPISTAQQTALNLKANLASPAFTGTPTGITATHVGLGSVSNESKASMFTNPTFTGTVNGVTKAHVGLSSVDNTADSAKPISTAQQTALNLKANLDSPTFTGTVNGITKAHVGLSNVDNTADSAKPVSTAQQTALNLKASLASPTFTGTVSGVTKTHVGLSNVDNTADSAKPVSTATQTALNLKVNNTQVLTDVPSGALFTDTVYTHPANHSATIITEDSTHRFTTDAEKTTWNGKQGALGFTPENSANKGTINGYAELDATGKIPASQLPSFVDDVVEYANLATFPVTGESGKIYIAIDTNITYRWSGSVYVVIGSTLSLGETSSTAYRGDRGKIAYDHSQVAHAPSNAQANNISDINATDLTDGGDSTLHYHSSDRARGNHTGTQLASTISDFVATVRSSVLTGLSTTTNAAITATDTVLSALGKLQKQISDNLSTLASHTGNTANPHSTTKTHVGLSNVDNTSDASKPVSTAQQSSLDLKANLASPTFTGTVGGITATMVGLGNVTNESKATMFTNPTFTGTVNGVSKTHVGLSNVDNTSDASKPVSTAQQTALNLKANLASPAFTGTPTGITKAHVGLGSVDNTADTAKPVSTAQQTALNLKANLASPAFTGTPTGITKTHVGLPNVDNTADSAKPVSTAQLTALNLKAPLNSPTLTGTPNAPTATAGTNTTQIATTAYVQGAISAGSGSPNLTDTALVLGGRFTIVYNSVTDSLDIQVVS